MIDLTIASNVQIPEELIESIEAVTKAINSFGFGVAVCAAMFGLSYFFLIKNGTFKETRINKRLKEKNMKEMIPVERVVNDKFLLTISKKDKSKKKLVATFFTQGTDALLDSAKQMDNNLENYKSIFRAATGDTLITHINKRVELDETIKMYARVNDQWTIILSKLQEKIAQKLELIDTVSDKDSIVAKELVDEIQYLREEIGAAEHRIGVYRHYHDLLTSYNTSEEFSKNNIGINKEIFYTFEQSLNEDVYTNLKEEDQIRKLQDHLSSTLNNHQRAFGSANIKARQLNVYGLVDFVRLFTQPLTVLKLPAIKLVKNAERKYITSNYHSIIKRTAKEENTQEMIENILSGGIGDIYD